MILVQLYSSLTFEGPLVASKIISGMLKFMKRDNIVIGSRGSVIPYFEKLIQEGKTKLPLTHVDMTRFVITLDQGVLFVLRAQGMLVTKRHCCGVHQKEPARLLPA